MLLDHGNPYRNGLPHVLDLGWDDFQCGLSPANESAIGKVADWAIFAYMAADCNLHTLMFDNLLELKTVGSNASVHVIVLFDGPLLTDSFIARLNPGAALADDILLRFSELHTSEADTLAMALRVASAFPARRRLLVLSGHGTGWRGALLDENLGMHYRRKAGRLVLPGDGAACDARLRGCLTQVNARLNMELEKAVAGSFRYDVLALDACYMGGIEAVAHLWEQADYLIISEDTMPGEGLAYGEILTELQRHPGQSPDALASFLLAATRTTYAVPGKRTGKLALAVMRTAEWPAFAESFVALVQALDLNDAACFAAVKQSMETAWPFDLTGTIDLKGFVQELLAAGVPDAAATAGRAVLQQWDRLIAGFSGPGGARAANGLCLYAPPPKAFEPAYIRASNALPLKLGIWAWFLGDYFLRRLGDEFADNPLLAALQATMHDLIARGIYTPHAALTRQET